MESRPLGGTGLTGSDVSFGARQLGNRQDDAPMDDATDGGRQLLPCRRSAPDLTPRTMTR